VILSQAARDLLAGTFDFESGRGDRGGKVQLAGGSLEEMRLAAPHLERDLVEDYPEVEAERAQLRQELGLTSPPVDVLLARLHESVVATGPDSFLIGPDGGRYGTLFTKFRVSDNPARR
jgi:hypothetical protein